MKTNGLLFLNENFIIIFGKANIVFFQSHHIVQMDNYPVQMEFVYQRISFVIEIVIVSMVVMRKIAVSYHFKKKLQNNKE